jgi:predicted DNA-binding transcriptional regulator AlpA
VPAKTKCPEPLPDHLSVPRDWMSPQDLADWLDVPVKSVYVWNSTGTGPRATRVGKHVRYSRQSIAAWLAAQESDLGAA